MSQNNKTKLLVKEIKGYSFRLLNLNNGKSYRALSREFKDMVVGELLTVINFDPLSELIEELEIIAITAPDSSKGRVAVSLDQFQIGDLVDGVPILNLGKRFYKDGDLRAYAYFK